MSPELQLSDALTFLAPLAASAVTSTAMHWWPGAKTQPPVARYVMGTMVTVGFPAATMVLSAALGAQYGPLFWAALLACNAVASGVAVAGAYWLDGQRPVSLEDVHDAARRE